MGDLNVNVTYPYNPEYEYTTTLERINLDDERKLDLLNHKGFVVSNTMGIKKDIKDPNSIYSPKFGQTLRDVNAFANRYRCECGHTMSRINNGTTCKICGTKVKYVDDDFKYFGWKVLQGDTNFLIHPNLYKSISFLIGKDFEKIITYIRDTDEDGNEHEPETRPEGQPFFGIGMLQFREKFDEVMKYYVAKSPNKEDYYNDIMKNREKVFIQSVPIFTTHLRPADLDKESFYFEESNGIYTIINKLIGQINSSVTKMEKRAKPIEQLLFDAQMEYMKLYSNIEEILSGKKGTIRSLFGGRYNFTSRGVIVANPNLRIDEVTLSYKCLAELLKQSIINILHKSYNMSYNDAYNYWYKSNIEKDSTIEKIINSIITSKPRGLELIINRNPSIQYGSILQMFCVGMTDTYTMAVPLQILPLLEADFDGDVLNIWYLINKDFFVRANQIFNPRNSMYISRNDGKFDNRVNHQRDTIINANTLMGLCRCNYSSEDLSRIAGILV